MEWIKEEHVSVLCCFIKCNSLKWTFTINLLIWCWLNNTHPIIVRSHNYRHAIIFYNLVHIWRGYEHFPLWSHMHRSCWWNPFYLWCKLDHTVLQNQSRINCWLSWQTLSYQRYNFKRAVFLSFSIS